MNAVPPEVTAATAGAPSAEPARVPWYTPSFRLAGIVAGVSLLLLVTVSLMSMVLGSLLYGPISSPYYILDNGADAVAWLGAAGLVAALIIAVVAWRSRPAAGDGPAPGAAAEPERPSRARLLWTALGLAAGSALVLVAFVQLGLGYGIEGQLVIVSAGLVALAGFTAAVVLAVRAAWPGRPTSLRTRAFFVIAIAVLIPSLCLAMLGVWAFYRSWETATNWTAEQSLYRAGELAKEISSVQRQAGRFSPTDRARLADAIAAMYGKRGHVEGAQLATLAQIRETSTLPGWAIRSLERRGFAIGSERRATDLPKAEIVAWRVGDDVVRYYVPIWGDDGIYGLSAPTPVGRLLWIAVLGTALIVAVGLLGAWLLSRGVVRPVRRLAEASGRLAEGEAGVSVKPEGPRELRELAVSFNDMNAKLTKAQETEQAFLLSVSHELKTPLTSIRGYAEGIGDGTVKPDDGADVIGAESSRLERLVGDLLESGRMRKSAFTVRRESVGLSAVAEDVVRRYEATARDAGLTLLINTEAGGGAVADHDRVLQVVSNLVENAIRCTPAPGSVTIATAPGAITVSDTGRGLTSDDLPRAFERFYLYTRYGTDRPVGTGLGLAIVKELTEAMGGAVSVSSAVGVGTAFTVALPACEAPAAAPVENAATAEMTAPLAAEASAATAALKDDES